jgi:hypothetical protein
VSLRRRIGPGRDAGVGGKPFANLVAPFVLRRAGEPAAAFASEGQRIGNRLGLVAPARFDRPAQRPPFQLYPDAPFERIEMLVAAVAAVLASTPARAECDGTVRVAGFAGVHRHRSPGAWTGASEPAHPPQDTGPSAKPEKRGTGPSGSGWLVARVPVA